MAHLTHLDARGQARMVDVGDKAETAREARASGRVRVAARVLSLIRKGKIQKGDVLAAARIAGIMAAKKTADLIPLCHPLRLDHASVDLTLLNRAVGIRTCVACRGRTGVEMEALAAAAAAALTIYDMCKSVDRGLVIERIRLEEKSGGRSGRYVRR